MALVPCHIALRDSTLTLKINTELARRFKNQFEIDFCLDLTHNCIFGTTSELNIQITGSMFKQ